MQVPAGLGLPLRSTQATLQTLHSPVTEHPAGVVEIGRIGVVGADLLNLGPQEVDLAVAHQNIATSILQLSTKGNDHFPCHLLLGALGVITALNNAGKLHLKEM